MASYTVIIAQERITLCTLAVSIEANQQAEAEAQALLIAENTCVTDWDEGDIEQQEAYVEEIRPGQYKAA